MFLNSFYIQKSKLLLYPLLGFEDKIFRPSQTYIHGDDTSPLTTPTIICSYRKDDKKNYLQIFNDVLIKNEKYISHTSNETHDYILYDLSKFDKDYTNFLGGYYSKFSEKTKDIILEFYGRTKIGSLLINVHLHPVEFHEMFSEVLNCSIESIKKSHETLDKPDYLKEMLKK